MKKEAGAILLFSMIILLIITNLLIMTLQQLQSQTEFENQYQQKQRVFYRAENLLTELAEHLPETGQYLKKDKNQNRYYLITAKATDNKFTVTLKAQYKITKEKKLTRVYWEEE